MPGFMTPPRRSGGFCSYQILIGAWLFVFYLSPLFATGQSHLESQMFEAYTNADNDSLRLLRMNQLSGYYYSAKNFGKGDSIIEKQIMLAEASK